MHICLWPINFTSLTNCLWVFNCHDQFSLPVVYCWDRVYKNCGKGEHQKREMRLSEQCSTWQAVKLHRCRNQDWNLTTPWHSCTWKPSKLAPNQTSQQRRARPNELWCGGNNRTCYTEVSIDLIWLHCVASTQTQLWLGCTLYSFTYTTTLSLPVLLPSSLLLRKDGRVY